MQLQCGLPQGVRRLVQLLRLGDKGGRGAEVSPSKEPLIVEEDAILGRRRPQDSPSDEVPPYGT